MEVKRHRQESPRHAPSLTFFHYKGYACSRIQEEEYYQRVRCMGEPGRAWGRTGGKKYVIW